MHFLSLQFLLCQRRLLKLYTGWGWISNLNHFVFPPPSPCFDDLEVKPHLQTLSFLKRVIACAWSSFLNVFNLYDRMNQKCALEHLVNVVAGVRGVKAYGLAQPFVAWPHSWLRSGSSTLFFTTSHNLQTSPFFPVPVLQHCQDCGWQSCTWMLRLPEKQNNRLEAEKALASDSRSATRQAVCMCLQSS